MRADPLATLFPADDSRPPWAVLEPIPRDARRILIVRLSARGDLVFASPLAGALRRRYPTAYIAWAAESHTADAIRHNPHLDEVIVWDRSAWKREAAWGRMARFRSDAASFLAALRVRRFDVAIDAQGLLRSALVAFLSGARVRIGLGSREGSRVFMTRVVPRGGDARAFASEYAHLAQAIGLDATDFQAEIPCGADDVAAAKRLLGPDRIERGFVAACPFSSRPYKQWPPSRWSTLLGRIRSEFGLGVALLGGPGDRAAAAEIVRGIEAPTDRSDATPPPIDLVGATTLGEASAVASLCNALVGVDTGLSHMAVAHGRPAALIFGSNTPYLDPPAPSAAILHSGRPCSPCRGKLTCDGRIDCMRDVSVDQVVAALARVRAARPTPRLASVR